MMLSSQWVSPRLNVQRSIISGAKNKSTLLVHPMPGEYFIGHIGRWQRLLGQKNPRSVIAHLRNIASGWATSETPNVCLIAAASGVDAQSYARDHTLIPYEFFCATTNNLDDEGNLNQSILNKYSDPTYLFEAMLCTECVKNDIRKYGFSYWHRSHQLPGRLWCGTHKDSQLRIITRFNKPFENLPQYWLETGKPHRYDWSGIYKNTVYERYIAISDQMLKRSGPVSNELFQATVSNVAMSYGVEIGKSPTVGKNKASLAQLLSLHISFGYVSHIFTSIDPENIHERRIGVDGIFLRPTNGSTAVAMAMALLMPKLATNNHVLNLDEASFAEMTQDATTVSQQFLNCNGSLTILEKSWQVGDILTRRRVRQSKDKIMHHFKDKPEILAFDAFKNGMSIADACMKFGADPVNLEKIIWLDIPYKTNIILYTINEFQYARSCRFD